MEHSEMMFVVNNNYDNPQGGQIMVMFMMMIAFMMMVFMVMMLIAHILRSTSHILINSRRLAGVLQFFLFIFSDFIETLF